jgi:hypothetical protein
MDPITQQTALASAGGKKDPVYVDDVFSTALYTGNASSNTVPSGLDFTEGSWLSWIKLRDGSDSHYLSDSTQKTGVCFDSLASDRTYGKQTGETTGINAVGTSSYSIQGGNNQVNGNTKKYTSWNFKAAPGFFDVVTFTGDGTSNRQIPHSLGSKPGLIICKALNQGVSWAVRHESIPTKMILLDASAGAGTAQGLAGTNTASYFNVSYSLGYVNTTGINYVAYVFADDDAQFGTDGDESIIKCGSYTGNGATGQIINLGFEPQFLLIKKSSGDGNWVMYDTMRDISDDDEQELVANTSAAEASQNRLTISSIGINLNTGSDRVNQNGQTYIYMAIRRPHKPPEAATEVFAIDTHTGSIPNYISGFPVDFVIGKDNINASNDYLVGSRLLGSKLLKTNSSEATINGNTTFSFDFMNGIYSNTGSANSAAYAWMFKRAPGFMDVVAYSGTGSARTVNHNLKVKPELMIIKCRTDTRSWIAYSSYSTAEKFLQFNDPFGSQDSAELFNDTEPTATQFTVGTSNAVNNADSTTGKYIAYLFATLPGISKVGSYTGTGNAINVDCGFTNGARFVLIKRADPHPTGAGSWYVWDSVRGIVSGNDPYILLDSPLAQVTNTDYIDPLGTGFTVTSSAPAALNASGGNYLFLAIA